MIKENIYKMETSRIHFNYTFYFWKQELKDMIESFKFQDDYKHDTDENNKFFTIEFRDRSSFHGYIKLKPEFEVLVKNHIFTERYDNAHIKFIEWNDGIVMIFSDGIYISECYCNLFDMDEFNDFFNLIKTDIPKKFLKRDNNVEEQNKHTDSSELKEMEKESYFKRSKKDHSQQ